MLKPKFPFLPEGRERIGILPWVIAVMMYLTGLTSVGGLNLFGAVDNWGSELQSKLTVQISVADEALRNEQVSASLEVLNDTRGVLAANPISDEEIVGLLEPWLGIGNIIDDLPVPALIDVTLDPAAPASLETLRERLMLSAPDATIDDHDKWLGQVKRLVTVLMVTLSFILGLVLLATVAIIVFGTHSRLSMYKKTVEIMHLIGADDGLISKEFEWRFLAQGLRGGLIGAFAALATLFALSIASGFGGNDLLPSITLDLNALLTLAMIPALSAVMTMITARVTVRRALSRMV